MSRSSGIKNKEESIDKRKMVYGILIGIFVILLLILNYLSMNKMLNSNSSLINDFEKPREEVKYREPAVAGAFYSADRQQLDEDVKHYLGLSDTTAVDMPKILIVPHAGYKYSGSVAAKAYSLLKGHSDKIKTVVLVGPAHYVKLNGASIPDYKSFKTPLGEVVINKSLAKKLTEKSSIMTISNKPHEREHSLEVQLPFLQKVIGKFNIVPIVYGDVSPEELAAALVPVLQEENTLLVFSADLSHYYSYDHAQEMDEHTSTLISNNDPDVLQEFSCGATGINAALILSKENKLYPETLELKNSGDVTGDKQSVVGYGAWSFTENKSGEKLVGIDKEIKSLENFAGLYANELREIVQISLEDAVEGKQYKPSRKNYSEALFDKGASFVTLTKNGELRGCIGTIIPREAIALDVAKSTYSAAMSDKRFSKLKKEELAELDFHISLLTSLERVRFLSEEDLLSKIVEEKDGLVMIDGSRQGLFLPSVWRQIPDKREFLQHLKIKTGLSPNYWSNKIQIYRFRVVEINRNAD